MTLNEIITAFREKSETLERASKDLDNGRIERIRCAAVASAWSQAADMIDAWSRKKDEP